VTQQPSAGRFRRAATEFVLIVTGVSVALGAQSLWDFGQDRDAEREYLSQLQSDLAENQRRLQDARELEVQQAAAARAALNALAAGAEIPADSAQAWLMERRGLFYSDPRPITGTFSALVETGDLRLIRDSAKRNAIISYLAQITADKAEFDRFVDDHLFALRMIRAAGSAPAQQWGSLGDSAVRAYLAVPTDPAVPTALEHLITATEVRQVYLGRMIEATRETAEALAGR
jgi:hypothetical protein